jgi:hypothetical protein
VREVLTYSYPFTCTYSRLDVSKGMNHWLKLLWEASTGCGEGWRGLGKEGQKHAFLSHTEAHTPAPPSPPPL